MIPEMVSANLPVEAKTTVAEDSDQRNFNIMS